MNHRCYLQNIVLIPKLFLLEHLRSALYHLFFFPFLKPFPDGVYLFKTMEKQICEICQVSMKAIEQNLSTVKAQEQHR